MPTLLELTTLFDGLPITHPPTPRKRLPPPSSKSNTKNAASAMTKAADAQAKSVRFVDEHNPTPATASLQTLFGWIRSFFSNPLLKTSIPARISTRPNPFPILKQGKKIVIIAVVDAGNVGFFRLGQGAFEEWPMA
jgi:tRNA-splicing endonuclease subunit Sen54